jgi:hypothetical protein
LSRGFIGSHRVVGSIECLEGKLLDVGFSYYIVGDGRFLRVVGFELERPT